MNEFNSIPAVKSYDYSIPNEWVKVAMGKASAKAPAGVAIDIGCGPGQFLAPIAEALGAYVVGMDTSDAMLVQAALKNHHGCLVKSSVMKMPFNSGSFSFGLMRYIVHHLNDWHSAVHEARRVICNGGILLIETADIKKLMKRPEYMLFKELGQRDLARWPDIDQILCQLNKSGFSNVECFDAKLIRDELEPSEYLERMHQWSLYGGGTSFWRMLNLPDRIKYVKYIKNHLHEMTVNDRFPILTESSFLMAM